MATIKELKLKKAITEMVKTVLKEDSNLYTRTIGGGPLGRDKYRGCKTIDIIWHGEFADPELYYNGKVINYYNIEDDLIEGAKDEGIDVTDDDLFNTYVQENEVYIQDLITTYGENDDRDKNPFENKKTTKKPINESSSNRKELMKIQKKIYKAVQPMTSKLFSDDAWQNVGKLLDVIRSVDGVDDLTVGAGEYYNYLNTSDYSKTPYRDYETIVYTQFGNLYGYVRCCAAGSVDNPFDKYDMVISLYPDKKRDLDESLKKKIKSIIKESYQKQILSELSGKTIQNAINKAVKLGRMSQARSIAIMNEKNLKNKYKNDSVVYVDDEYFIYNDGKEEIKFTTNGSFYRNNNRLDNGTNYNTKPTVPERAKVSDRVLCRYLADWWSDFGCNPEWFNWHDFLG